MTLAAPTPGTPGWLVLERVAQEPGDWTAQELAVEFDLDAPRVRRWLREWRRPLVVPGRSERAALVAPSLVRAFPGAVVKWYQTGTQSRIVAALLESGPQKTLELARATGGTWTDDGGRERTLGSWERALAGLYDWGDVAPASRAWPTPAAVELVTAPPSSAHGKGAA